MKFKIRDKARVKKGLKVGERYGNDVFMPDMDCGVVTISHVRESVKKYDVEGTGYCYTDEMLEPFEPTYAMGRRKKGEHMCDGNYETEDVVREPSHYKHGKFETIDEMILVFGAEATLAYCKICAWKYRSRAPYKGKSEEDMKKSSQYLEFVDEILKRMGKAPALIKEG